MRRRRDTTRGRAAEPALSVLLADVGAAQATSPTALAQARVGERVRATSALDSQVDLFAGDRAQGADQQHRFAPIDREVFSPRQQS